MTLLVIFIVLAIGVSFLCSVFEAVLLSITPSYVAQLRQSHPKAAERWNRHKENIEAPLVAILTLNTIAHTVGAAGAGAQAAVVFGSDVIAVFSAVLTFAILFFSEIIPKTLGANYWRTLAPTVAVGLDVLVWVTKPLVWLSLKLTAVLGKGESGHYIRAEMSAMAELGAESGELNAQESNILKQMLQARSVPVTAVMTPRTVIHSLDQTLTLRQFAHQHGALRFSRIPVYDKGSDDIVGYVNRSEALLAEKHQPEDTLKSLRHPMVAVPENAKLMALFELLLKKHTQIAIVVDEYGSVLGLVTMEDIIESLLGLEIVDLTDPAVDMQQVARKLWEHRQKQRKIRVSNAGDDEDERRSTEEPQKPEQ